MSSGKQSAPSKFSGIFQKKSEEEKVDNAAATKKKKHKKQPSVTLETDFSPEIEADWKQGALDVMIPSEKEKPRSIRRRLPFGKPQIRKKHKLKPGAKGKAQEETAMDFDAELKGSTVKFEMEEHTIESSSEGESKEVLIIQIAEAIPAEPVSEIASKIEESGTMLSHETYSDESPLKIQIPNPEGYVAFEEKISLSPMTEIVDRARDIAISSNFKFQWGICLYVCVYSLHMLVDLWSVFFTRASDATKQLLLYFISSLIKRYPQCFKQLAKTERKKKRRSKNALEDKVQTAQAQSVANED